MSLLRTRPSTLDHLTGDASSTRSSTMTLCRDFFREHSTLWRSWLLLVVGIVVVLGWRELEAREPRADNTQRSETTNDLDDFYRLFPEDPLFWVQVRDADQWLQRLVSERLRQTILTQFEATEFWRSPEGLKLAHALNLAQGVSGIEPWELTQKVLSGRVAVVGLRDASGHEGGLAAVESKNVALLRRVLGTVELFGHDSITRTTAGGTTIVQFPGVAYCWDGDVLVLADRAPTLVAALERKRSSQSKSLANVESYREVVQRNTPIQFAVKPNTEAAKKLQELLMPVDEPMESLLFGGYRQLLGNADLLTVECDARPLSDGSSLDVRAVVQLLGDTAEAALATCFFPKAERARVPDPKGLLARVDLQRNLSDWWDRRGDLVTERARERMTRFATDIGNLLGGRDLDEEIFSLARGGGALFLLEAPEFEIRPEPLLPSFALLVPVEERPSRDSTLQMMFQSALAFANIERMGQRLPAFLIQSEVHRGATLTYARSAEGGVDVDHNFQPAMAIHSDHFVLGSHPHAVRALLDALASDEDGAAKIATPTDQLLLVGKEAVTILRKNRDALVAEELVKGKSIAKAEQDIDFLLWAVSFLRQVELSVTVEGRTAHVDFSVSIDEVPNASTGTDPKPASGKPAKRF